MAVSKARNIESLDEICESLDNLYLKNLELMEEKIQANIQMEIVLREGHIELAKARYIRGKESMGRLQLPTKDEEVFSLFDLETTISEEKEIPHFDISLKKSNDNDQDIQDPIKRFGVLVPQNLRNAQKKFQESLYHATKVANVSAELFGTQNELESLMNVKKSLCGDKSKIKA
ncbi:coiled-coil domain-containing protein 115-like [Belonocnema kinseyi]|uniref:coiled-coil domain-containing protein 115-like n=1 Tax=Belonocnema kinseyi TaxID=2817044 RepID=UPI00143DE15D|nr:coiled-coil domain-containing protein 115-like [Belonocnema kinseyi]